MNSDELREKLRHCRGTGPPKIVVSEFPRNHLVYWSWIEDHWVILCDWFDPHNFSDIARNTTRHCESDHAWNVLEEAIQHGHSPVVLVGDLRYEVVVKAFVHESERSVENSEKVCRLWAAHFTFEQSTATPYAQASGVIECGFSHEYSIIRTLHALAKEAVGESFSHIEARVSRISNHQCYFKGDNTSLSEGSDNTPSNLW